MRQHLAAATVAAIGLVPLSTGAQTDRDYGTPRDARLMLERVIGALKTDEAKALHLFIEGAPGFREADLYPYCGGPEGMFTAHPALMGSSLRALRDKRGNPLGQWLYETAKEGEIHEVTYYWPRPELDRGPAEGGAGDPHRRPSLRRRLLPARPSRQGGHPLEVAGYLSIDGLHGDLLPARYHRTASLKVVSVGRHQDSDEIPAGDGPHPNRRSDRHGSPAQLALRPVGRSRGGHSTRRLSALPSASSRVAAIEAGRRPGR